MEATRYTTSFYLSGLQKEPIQDSLNRKRVNGGLFSLFQNLEDGQRIRLTRLPLKSDGQVTPSNSASGNAVALAIGFRCLAHIADAGHKISQDKPQPPLTIG